MNRTKSQKYIKSFSKGQITVPKEFRDLLGLGDVFWLKLSLDQNKIIAEPIENNAAKANYSDKLLDIKGDWFSNKELEKNRLEIKKRLVQNG